MDGLFGATSLAVAIIDLDQRITEANEAAAAVFGLPALAGRPAAELVPHAGPVLRSCFELARTDAAMPEYIFAISERAFTLTFHPQRNAASGAEELLVVAFDLTRRLHLEKVMRDSRRRLIAMARRDHLTRLLNRRGLETVLHRELRRTKRANKPLSLLLIDIDWFKAYNDSLGHQQGDLCLRLVADALVGCLRRAADAACRYGGEEFVLILPETDAAGAATVAANCQQAIERLAIAHPACSDGRITASIGVVVAEAPGTGEDYAESLFARADRALYRAKQDGRNRVEFACENEDIRSVPGHGRAISTDVLATE